MKLAKILATLILGGSTVLAHADVLYSNSPGWSASCAFSTVCAARNHLGNVYAAQQFTLNSSAALSLGTFVVDGEFAPPDGINWMILSDNAGNPARVEYSGKNFPYTIFHDPKNPYLDLSVDLAGVTLGAGTYYFAIQSILPAVKPPDYWDNYLYVGLSGKGAFESFDGGVTWAKKYQGMDGIAVSISGTFIPEPNSIALAGLGLLGLVGVRRKKQSV